MKKKTLKPWRLEYQWKSLEDYHRYCIRADKDAYTSGWFKGYTKYENLEMAQKGLQREFIDPYYDAIAGGRNWRLFNTVTEEIVTIIIEKTKIILI